MAVSWIIEIFLYSKATLEIILVNSDLNQPLQKYIPENTSPKTCCMHTQTHTHSQMSTRQTKEILKNTLLDCINDNTLVLWL